ncbi:MAG: response regulator [Pseudomonadales bacterium]|nr:response regulator [Pseudomonadales bacterium]
MVDQHAISNEALINRLLSVMGAFFSAILIAVCALGYLILSKTGQLAQVSQRFSEGDNSARLPVKNKTEFDDAFQQFNHMADQIDKVQNQLIDSKERLELAAKASGLGIWELDLRTNRLTWDTHMHRLYETPEAEMSSEDLYGYWLSRLHPEDVMAAETSFKKALETQENWEVEFRVVMPDERIKYIKSMATFERVSGSAIKIIGGNLEISAQRRLEIRLRESVRLATAANDAKSAFLANMSHEIRTPMNGVLGIIELLKKTPLNERQQEYLTLVTSSAQTLLTLLNDILDLSKIEAGQMQLRPDILDLEKCIETVTKGFGPSAHKKHLNLQMCIDPELPKYITADATRLGQILFNLLGNAIKFTPSGEVSVEVNFGSDSIPAPNKTFYLLLTVSDTGIGIEPKLQSKILAPFNQLDSSATRQYGGAGLGLTIVNQLVSLMGGHLYIRSELDSGTSITARVPVLVPDSEQYEAKLKSDVRPDFNLQLQPILILDPSLINRNWLYRVIHYQKGRADSTPFPEEALEKINLANQDKSPYKLLILDWQVLHQNPEYGSRLQASHSGPIIVQLPSSYEDENLAAFKALEQTNQLYFLKKPASQSDLCTLMIKALSVSVPAAVSESCDAADNGPIQVLNILVAEDNLVNQTLIEDLLEEWGHKVTLVDNGRDALELSDSNQFDVILMDVQMPVMDGLTATREIRARERETNQHIPIIALTAHALKGDKEICLAAGMDIYLTKPLVADQLYEALLSQRPRSGQSPPPLADSNLDSGPA